MLGDITPMEAAADALFALPGFPSLYIDHLVCPDCHSLFGERICIVDDEVLAKSDLLSLERMPKKADGSVVG